MPFSPQVKHSQKAFTAKKQVVVQTTSLTPRPNRFTRAAAPRGSRDPFRLVEGGTLFYIGARSACGGARRTPLTTLFIASFVTWFPLSIFYSLGTLSQMNKNPFCQPLLSLPTLKTEKCCQVLLPSEKRTPQKSLPAKWLKERPAFGVGRHTCGWTRRTPLTTIFIATFVTCFRNRVSRLFVQGL